MGAVSSLAVLLGVVRHGTTGSKSLEKRSASKQRMFVVASGQNQKNMNGFVLC